MNNTEYNPSVQTLKQKQIVERAYYFALSFKKPRQCTNKKLEERFGNRAREPYKWAMENLLECTNGYSSKMHHIAKEYIRNDKGLSYLSDLLEGKTNISFAEFAKNYTAPYNTRMGKYYTSNQYLEREFGAMLRNQKLIYEEIGSRYYHPLQSIEKSARNSFLAQNRFVHDYDIECCNITLLLQYAEKCYKELLTLGDDALVEHVSFHGLYEYKSDRRAARVYLSKKFDISVDDAKEIFTSLLNGSNLSYVYGKLVLKYGQELCRKIKNDPFVKRFIRGVASIWKIITRHGIIKGKDVRSLVAYPSGKTVKFRRKRLDSKQKSEVYFMLEGVVVKLYRKFLKNNGIKSFMIHDGFVTNKLVDTYELKKYIFEESGFEVEFEHKIID